MLVTDSSHKCVELYPATQPEERPTVNGQAGVNSPAAGNGLGHAGRVEAHVGAAARHGRGPALG